MNLITACLQTFEPVLKRNLSTPPFKTVFQALHTAGNIKINGCKTSGDSHGKNNELGHVTLCSPLSVKQLVLFHKLKRPSREKTSVISERADYLLVKDIRICQLKKTFAFDKSWKKARIRQVGNKK